MAISGALRLVGESSPENKDRARESTLGSLARPATSPGVLSRGRFAFAVMQATLIMVGALGLMVGVATAAELSLRSIAEQVVQTLVEPLPLSAEGLQHSAVLNAAEPGTFDKSAGVGRPAGPVDGADAVVEASVSAGSPDMGHPRAVNPPAQGGQRSRANPSTGAAPDRNPHGNGDAPRDNASHSGGESPAGDHGNQPGRTDPAVQNPSHSSQAGGDEHNSANCAGNQRDSTQQAETGAKGIGPGGDQPNGSNASSGPSGSGAEDPKSDGSTEQKPSHGGAEEKGGSK
jgi:hypothetical protein